MQTALKALKAEPNVPEKGTSAGTHRQSEPAPDNRKPVLQASVLQQAAESRLTEIKQRGLYRTRRERPLHDSFQGNDYLGLSKHKTVVETYKRALDAQGTGSGGSPLITGYSASHKALESELADWLGTDKVVLFSSGFAANCGLMDVLDSLNAVFFVDRLCHASVYSHLRSISQQGASLQGRKGGGEKSARQHSRNIQRVHRFQHNNVSHLSQLLAEADATQPESAVSENPSDRQPPGLNVVSTEGTFSMDGDSAPLEALAELCLARPYRDTVLHIDDAHALGCTGQQGRGAMSVLKQYGDSVPVIMTGTFGKAFGQSGAFIACNAALANLIVNQCKHYIYSTAFAPAQAEALRSALGVIRGEEGDALRSKLDENIRLFRTCAMRRKLPLTESQSAIQPVIIGSNEAALKASEWLRKQGLIMNPIRPPTVPSGTARFRITLSAMHTPDQISELVDCVAGGIR